MNQLIPRAALVLLTCSLILLCPSVAFGQHPHGNLAGTARDTSGAVIPGSSVMVTNDHTEIRVIVQPQGNKN